MGLAHPGAAVSIPHWNPIATPIPVSIWLEPRMVDWPLAAILVVPDEPWNDAIGGFRFRWWAYWGRESARYQT